MSTQLEINVINRFIVKEKQQRYIQFITSGSTRKKFINALPHFKDFQWHLFDEIGNESEILSRLKFLKYKINDCYIISEDPQVDQKILSINEAMRLLGGYRDHATILVFGNADLVYYEGEPPHNQYLSKIQ